MTRKKGGIEIRPVRSSSTIYEQKMVVHTNPSRAPSSLDGVSLPLLSLVLPGSLWHLMKRSTAPLVKSRLRIVSAAADIFHKKGVRTAHIGEIAKAAGVTRQQLYHHFRTKGDIAEEVVRAYLAGIKTGTSRLHGRLESWSDLKRIFIAHIELFEEFQMRRGCPLGIIANELTEEDETIRQDLNLVFEALKERIATFLKKEKSEARLVPTADEEQLAHLYVATMQGAMLIGKVRRDSHTIKGIFEDLWRHFSRYKA